MLRAIASIHYRRYLLALLLLALVVVASRLTPFLNIEGLLIVIGGCTANALLSYHKDDVVRAWQCISQLYRRRAPSRQNPLHKDIMQMIMWSYILQAQGLPGLEKAGARAAHDSLQRYGLDLVVTGYDAAKVREMMQTVANAEFERRCAPVAVLQGMAASAPAFGMVGTLIGMILMMGSLSGNIAGLESGMGVAMLATLYGILIARLVCLPGSDRLLAYEEQEHFHKSMLIEGMALLAERRKPYHVQDRLNSFLAPSQHVQLNKHMQAAFNMRFALAS